MQVWTDGCRCGQMQGWTEAGVDKFRGGWMQVWTNAGAELVHVAGVRAAVGPVVACVRSCGGRGEATPALKLETALFSMMKYPPNTGKD